MLKSTHRPDRGVTSLPQGWTEHKAPTGHTYYYNASTKESTYTRPSVLQQANASQPLVAQQEDLETQLCILGVQNETGFPISLLDGQPSAVNEFQRRPSTFFEPSHRRGGFRDADRSSFRKRPQLVDRPKSKHPIPGCDPWVLVRTKLGRRFVHHPEDHQSYWKFPPEVMKHVIELDRFEREKNEKREGDEEKNLQVEPVTASTEPVVSEEAQASIRKPSGGTFEDDSDEYEEVEVTDDEDEENSSKRQRTGGETEEQPVEFNEDDIAFQLAAIGQDYGLDPGEYGDGESEDWEEGAEGLPLTEEDSKVLFRDLLNDHHVSPYKPWEKIIEEGFIIEDDRYTVLINMKARKEAWAEWSRERIQQLREQREKAEKRDPRIPYLAFLEKNATPKLYWPEFRRKYMKDPEMKHSKLSDKEREKWYRDYINRLKLPETILKSDLTSLLKSLPLHSLNRSTKMDVLPSALLTDIRYISLRSSIRNPLIEAYIATSPVFASSDQTLSPEEHATLMEQKVERERRERAMAERERKISDEKRRQGVVLRSSRGMLRDGEVEIERAMRVRRGGLLGYLEEKEETEETKEGGDS